MTIPANAMMIRNAQREYGSFAQMVAEWPSERITELWDHLKKHGKRLGGTLVPTPYVKWVKIHLSCRQMLKHTCAQLVLSTADATPNALNKPQVTRLTSGNNNQEEA